METKLLPPDVWFGCMQQNQNGQADTSTRMPTVLEHPIRPSVLQPTFSHYDSQCDTSHSLFSTFPAMHPHPELDYGSVEHHNQTLLGTQPRCSQERPSVLHLNNEAKHNNLSYNNLQYYPHRSEHDLLFPPVIPYPMGMPLSLPEASSYLAGIKREAKSDETSHLIPSLSYSFPQKIPESVASLDTVTRSLDRALPRSMDCQVCQSTQANGLHFGARTCAACAAFFRRTISDNKKYICKRSQRCTNASRDGTGYRKICRSCRMKRCLEIGMLPESVPADRAHVSVGDEIAAVNDWTPEGETHQDVINHIDECIRTKLIQLKIQRRLDDPVATDLKLGLAKITHAFLVSVDKSHVNDVIKNINRKYPDARVVDMETLAHVPQVFDPGFNLKKSIDLSVHLMEASAHIIRIAEEHDHTAPNHLCIPQSVPPTQSPPPAHTISDQYPCTTTTEVKEIKQQKQIEDEFLRDSLRSSKKLIALENKRETVRTSPQKTDPQKELNKACYTNVSCSRENGGPSAEKEMALKEVISSVDRVVEHLSRHEGRQDDGNILRQYFHAAPVQQALQQVAAARIQTSSAKVSTVEREGKKVHLVTVYKGEDSYLGATVRNEEDRVIVGRVVKGGLVEETNAFREGDELLEMNGIDLRGKMIGEVCEMLRNMSGEIEFVVNPRAIVPSETEDPHTSTPSVVHLRALFDYDPEDDVYVPCKELALKFHRGDILHVISTEDEHWWQAHREGDDRHALAGLIPSSSFHQQIALYTEELERESRPRTRKEARKRLPDVLKTLRRKKSDEMRSKDEIDDSLDPTREILCYEEVVLHLARSGQKRPLVLCGPEGVGCLTLRKRLLEADTERLAGIIPHTTRVPAPGEVNGVHYHFVTRQQFQEDVRSGSFVEWGEFEKNYYGTSRREIRSVIQRMKTCILTMKPESLSSIRTSEFLPYIVFIAPPSLTVLRRQKEAERCQNPDKQPVVKDEDLKNILTSGKTIEQKFGHHFDHIIVNTDVENSLKQLRNILQKLDTEPQWVPANWLQNGKS